MKLYFVTNNPRYFEFLIEKKARNVLVSYLNNKFIERIKNYSGLTIMMDSGAYTVWTKGEVIDLDEYISYCKQIRVNNKFKEFIIINLDVIPGRFGHIPLKAEIEKSAEQGWKNYVKMREAGLDVMHIFHQHEDFKWLDRLLKEDVDYIGISPANDLSSKRRLNWLKKVFRVVRDKKKTHGFGVTDVKILKEIPFYSADSSNWLTLVIYGVISHYDKKYMKPRTLRYKTLEDALEMKLNPKALTHRRILAEELAKVASNTLQMEKDLTKLWSARGINWQD